MNIKSRIVLVSCCAPCSCGAISELKEQGADFIVLFFNPNIYPESEYQKRLDEQIKYCESHGVKYHIGHYDHGAWLRDVAGLENDEPERGARCSACFRHRFRYAQKFAHDNGYDAIASVLGVSRHKDQAQVDEVGAQNHPPKSQISAGPGVCARYLPINWDENLRTDINKNSAFYRQNYCGCEFSIRK